MKNLYLLAGMLVLLALVAGCKDDVQEADVSSTSQKAEVVGQSGGLSGTVSETMDASGYTYVLVDTATEKIWVAGPKTQVVVGDEVNIAGGSPISNFESKTLGRTFDTILFASAISVAGAEQAFPGGGEGTDRVAAAVPQVVTDFSGLAKPDGGKTVEDVYKNSVALSGQNVVIRAKVIKFMSGIMGKNWLHIKDGSGAAGTDDLVVTTDASVDVGATVLISGVVASNKDFGSGYKYDVIVEDAEVTVE